MFASLVEGSSVAVTSPLFRPAAPLQVSLLAERQSQAPPFHALHASTHAYLNPTFTFYCFLDLDNRGPLIAAWILSDPKAAESAKWPEINCPTDGNIKAGMEPDRLLGV